MNRVKSVLAAGGEFRVVTEQRPVSRLDRGLLLVETVSHVDAVRDAVGVRDDQRRAVIGFGFEKSFDRLRVASA